MSTISIPRGDWNSFLQSFSRQHSGWQVQFETYDRQTGENVKSPIKLLHSIALDLEDEKNPRINVTVRTENKEVRHILFRPSHVTLYIAEHNGEDALKIDSLNTESKVHLRGPGRTTVVDKAG